MYVGIQKPYFDFFEHFPYRLMASVFWTLDLGAQPRRELTTFSSAERRFRYKVARQRRVDTIGGVKIRVEFDLAD